MGNNVKIKLGKRDVRKKLVQPTPLKEEEDRSNKVVTTKSIKQEK